MIVLTEGLKVKLGIENTEEGVWSVQRKFNINEFLPEDQVNENSQSLNSWVVSTLNMKGNNIVSATYHFTTGHYASDEVYEGDDEGTLTAVVELWIEDIMREKSKDIFEHYGKLDIWEKSELSEFEYRDNDIYFFDPYQEIPGDLGRMGDGWVCILEGAWEE